MIILFTMAIGHVGCAYFNTFYNTKKAFKDGERVVRTTPENQGGSPGVQFFDLCIEKGSRVLELYPGSKYVDDTLFLMGKSFFYKQDYVEAIRKFEELKNVFPESKFIPEAELWWGKALIRLEDYDEAYVKLNDLLTSNKLKKEMRNEALLEIASMSFRQSKFDEAVKSYQELTTVINDEEILAKVWFNIGVSHDQLKQYSDAAESYLKVLKYKPTEEERYRANLNAGVSCKLDSQYDKAAGIFEELMKDGKNAEKFPEIRLEITDCLTRQGKKDEAIEAFEEIAEFYPNTIARTRAYGLIGLIYYNMGDYPRARAVFDSSLRGVRDSLTTEKITPLAVYLRSLDEYHINIDTVVKEIRNRKNEEKAEPAGVINDSMNVSSMNDSSGNLNRKLALVKKLKIEKQMLQDSYAKPFYLAGELFLYKIGVPDSSEWYFNFIDENFKSSVYAPRSLLQLSHICRDVKHDTAKAHELLNRIISEYPEDEYVNFARKEMGLQPVYGIHDSIRGLFLKAESLFFDAQNYEEALAKYAVVCDSFPNSEYAPKSRYIIAWYYENAMYDSERALREYDKLMDDFPESAYRRLVEDKVKMLEQQIKNGPEKVEKKDKSKKERRRRADGRRRE